MTREEARARLEANRGAFVFKETNEALDMAIEALSAEPKMKVCEERQNGECPFYTPDWLDDDVSEPSDLISRADAIEAVAQQWLFEASAESPYVNDDDIGEYRKLAEELFKDVPSAEAKTKCVARIEVDTEEIAKCIKEEYGITYWRTPCSERLPKKGEVVLITNGKGNVRCGQYRSEYDVRGETHYWWWKGKTVEIVLAWMPLPKPYREESEAEK